MRPKFEVGEVVILQSATRPDCKGEFTVLQVNCLPAGVPFEFSGSNYRHSSTGVSYFLNDDFLSYMGEGKACWNESTLRKKHTPGELSFTDLMASLSSPKLITHQT